jgi:hypothetical protein
MIFTEYDEYKFNGEFLKQDTHGYPGFRWVWLGFVVESADHFQLLTWQVTIAFCASITTARGWEIVQLSGIVHQIFKQQVEQRIFHWIESISCWGINPHWGLLGNIGESFNYRVESSIYVAFFFLLE